nr:adenosine deaminase [uncultured Cohaesibacter sp.]
MQNTNPVASGQSLLKAELHVHIEGAAHPELVHRLAERHGKNLDAFMRDDGTYIWSDFTNFLQCYDKVAAVICTPEDYADLTEDYLLRNAEEGCFYTEFFLSPDHVALMGMSYDNLLEGISEGYERAKAKSNAKGFPLEARFIVTCLRHMGPEAAIDVARRVAARPHPLVTGFGMGGDERLFSQRAFAPAFRIAHDAGLACTTHAGEFGNPLSVTDALDHLPVTRIGHGVRSVEDPDLVRRLVDEAIVLEVCPHSNVALGLYPSLAEHPLATLIEAGVLTTLSSDDPPFFSTSVGKEYDVMAATNGWGRETMKGFTRRSLEAAFLDEATRAQLLDRLDRS